MSFATRFGRLSGNIAGTSQYPWVGSMLYWGVIFNQAAGVDRSCPQHSAWISSKAMWRGLSFTADALKKRLRWARYRQCACQRSSSSSTVCWMMALQNSAQWDQPVKERKWQSRQFTAAVRMQMALEKVHCPEKPWVFGRASPGPCNCKAQTRNP